MIPMNIYRLVDGTTRQYREGEQPKGAVRLADAAPRQTPEKAAATRKRTTKPKTAEKASE